MSLSKKSQVDGKKESINLKKKDIVGGLEEPSTRNCQNIIEKGTSKKQVINKREWRKYAKLKKKKKIKSAKGVNLKCMLIIMLSCKL